MNAILTPIPCPSLPWPPPPVLPRVELTPERDAITRVVLRYFAASRDSREHADAFDHLVASLYRAVQPFFLRDRHGSFAITATPQFDNIDGQRNGHSARREGDKVDVTRQWIREWLLRFLVPYQKKSKREIIAAADAGKFRWLGLWCRLRLKQIVYRQYKREKKERLAGFETATEYLGTEDLGVPSPLRAHAPFDQIGAAVSDARRVVMANADLLEKLDILSGLLAYLSVAEQVTEPYFEGKVTTAIMDVRGVQEAQARAYKRKYHETVKRELAGRNPVLQAVINELTQPPLSFVVPSASTENSDNRQLLRESRQLMAGFGNDCRADGLGQSAKDAWKEERRLEKLLRESEERVVAEEG